MWSTKSIEQFRGIKVSVVLDLYMKKQWSKKISDFLILSRQDLSHLLAFQGFALQSFPNKLEEYWTSICRIKCPKDIFDSLIISRRDANQFMAFHEFTLEDPSKHLEDSKCRSGLSYDVASTRNVLRFSLISSHDVNHFWLLSNLP